MMEFGKVSELTVLTPSEADWVRRVLCLPTTKSAAMAKSIVHNGLGRKLVCVEPECAKAPEKYLVSQKGNMIGYCAEHAQKDLI